MKTLEVRANGVDLVVPYQCFRKCYIFKVYGKEFKLQWEGNKAFTLLLHDKEIATVTRVNTVWATESKKLSEPVFADVTVQWRATPVVSAVRAIALMHNSL